MKYSYELLLLFWTLRKLPLDLENKERLKNTALIMKPVREFFIFGRTSELVGRISPIISDHCQRKLTGHQNFPTRTLRRLEISQSNSVFFFQNEKIQYKTRNGNILEKYRSFRLLSEYFISKFICFISTLNFLTVKSSIFYLGVYKTMRNFLVHLLWLWIDFCWISPKVIFSQLTESFCVYSVFPENISTAKSRGKALHCYENVTHRDERSREVDFS